MAGKTVSADDLVAYRSADDRNVTERLHFGHIAVWGFCALLPLSSGSQNERQGFLCYNRQDRLV
jgi:hypothetical protein